LQLLDEPAQQTATAADQSGATQAAPSANAPLCYTLGPFKEQQQAQQVIQRFSQDKIKITSRSSVEQEYMGMMVYIDGHENREAAISTAQELRKKGIDDYIIVNEPDKTNVLSLGVFGLKKNAERHQARIEALGYQAKTEPRYRKRRIYWLDYSRLETQALGTYIDELKRDLGISRIARQCS
jgi:hypothetical protein